MSSHWRLSYIHYIYKVSLLCEFSNAEHMNLQWMLAYKFTGFFSSMSSLIFSKTRILDKCFPTVITLKRFLTNMNSWLKKKVWTVTEIFFQSHYNYAFFLEVLWLLTGDKFHLTFFPIGSSIRSFSSEQIICFGISLDLRSKLLSNSLKVCPFSSQDSFHRQLLFAENHWFGQEILLLLKFCL